MLSAIYILAKAVFKLSISSFGTVQTCALLYHTIGANSFHRSNATISRFFRLLSGIPQSEIYTKLVVIWPLFGI